jgi:hypothetical protein
MKTWQRLLAKAEKLIRGGNSSLYQRVVLLAQVFDDPEFGRDAAAEGTNPLGMLNDKTSDTCANFTELYQMLKMFPSKDQWVNGNISEMRLQMIAAHRPPSQRRPAIDADADADDADSGHVNGNGMKHTASVEHKSWKVDALKGRAKMDQMAAEIRHLKGELKKAHARIRQQDELLKNFSRRRQPAK